jgi:hypothetical protein
LRARLAGESGEGILERLASLEHEVMTLRERVATLEHQVASKESIDDLSWAARDPACRALDLGNDVPSVLSRDVRCR